jgi:hypothetical protein
VRQNAKAWAKVLGVERLSASGPPALDGEREVILATPTQMYAAQALRCLEAGKHVQVEIPLADSLRDEAVVAMQKRTGLVAMCGHTRRFNPTTSSSASDFRRASSASSGWTCRPILLPHQYERARPAAILDRRAPPPPRRKTTTKP